MRVPRRPERLARTGVRAHFGSEMLRVGGLKGFADGSLGSTTALFYEPYKDWSHSHRGFSPVLNRVVAA
jgi:predicted amidohydrolase YtcJ